MAYKSKILIVDDEPRMCDSLEVLLNNEGYKTQTAYSGHEALKWLGKQDIDLVLLMRLGVESIPLLHALRSGRPRPLADERLVAPARC